MRESELLKHIYRRSADLDGTFPQVVVGPGHDCAVIATPGGECLLMKVDQVIAGQHFRPWPHTPLDLIARKAIARAVSDIAACGGRPSACMISAVLAADFSAAEELFDALSKWAVHWGCPVVGGDTSSWRRNEGGEGMVISVSIVGLPHPQRGPVLRSGAAVGDGVYVTGQLGGSLDPETGHGRHLLFEPRLGEARWLCDTLGERLHAMMDLSDGLGRDGGRMAEMSGVRLRLNAAKLPLRPRVSGWKQAAGDGEDYELLFTASGDVPEQALQLGTRVTRIGTVLPGAGCVVADEDGREIDVSELGWEYGSAAGRERGDNSR